MRIRLTRLLEGAIGATGHVVIVDVFRAFTTAAFCAAAGAREIVLVGTAEEALALKGADPSLFLTGEIDGRPIPGFDAGNSPSAIARLDLRDRRVVQRTSAGTQGVVAAKRAAAIVLGSLVTASATARYLSARAGEVTIVAMGHAGIVEAEEDRACAEHLAALLRGERPAPPRIRLHGDERGWPEWFPREDAVLALDVDRFDFALPVVHEDGRAVARPVRP